MFSLMILAKTQLNNVKVKNIVNQLQYLSRTGEL